MLKSYEALYENGQIKWLGEQPDIPSAYLIVTVLKEGSSDDVIEPGDNNLSAAIENRFADLGDFDLPVVPREPIKLPPDFTEI